MTTEEELRLKLRKIEALFSGAGTPGERTAAEAAMERIQEKLRQAPSSNQTTTDGAVEYKFSLNNQWSRQLFVALCRRHNLTPYRRYRQRHTTIMVKLPSEFVDKVLWPEFQALNKVLEEYIAKTVEKIIREEVHNDVTEAPEVKEPLSIAG